MVFKARYTKEFVVTIPAPPSITKAIQQARLALQRGDKRAVRHWAELALAQDAALEEPWPTPLPTDTPAPQQADAPAPNYESGKLILVDISEQHMYAYENGMFVFSFVVSTGMNSSTRTGTFSILNKIPNAYGSTWNIWMPNWLGIYWAGPLQNGIHALPILPNGQRLWSGYLGTPISYGCIVLGTYESELLYNWAEVGTPVVIQY